MAFGFFKKIVKTAGKGVSGVAKITGTVGKGLGKIPVVGGGVKGVYNLTFNAPFKVADAVVKGGRLDKVALNTLKQSVKDVKDVAPYAQMVVSVVPGVGQGVSAAIGSGLALASGQPISAAIVAGVRAAIPGGPIAQAAFDIGKAAVEGKPISEVAVSGLPLTAEQKKLFISRVRVSSDVSNGSSKNTGQVDEAFKMLPTSLQKALTTGMALGAGTKLQANAKSGINLSALMNLDMQGQNVIKANPVLSAGKDIIKTDQRKGFAIATALMQQKLTPSLVTNVRAKLSAADQKGFDLAMSVNVAGMTSKAPTNMSAREKFGYLAVKGSATASKDIKQNVGATVAADNSAKLGAVVAIETGGLVGFWKRLYYAITGKLPPVKKAA